MEILKRLEELKNTPGVPLEYIVTLLVTLEHLTDASERRLGLNKASLESFEDKWKRIWKQVNENQGTH